MRLRLAGDPLAPNPLDSNVEAFDLDVSEKGVDVAARHERGLLHATHYIERLMADRGAPWLRREKRSLRPRFTPRMTNSIFIAAYQDAGDLSQYGDDYLSLMSHYGANGIHAYVSLWDYCRNDTLPQLNSPDFDEKTRRLNAVTDRLASHGIDFYLVINNYPPLPEDHPVFAADPSLRGAPHRVHEGIPVRRLLCGGSERAMRCYEEALRNLFLASPGLAGAVFCVGGEGFMHCFSRPYRRGDAATSCPHCAGKDPSAAVAEFSNRIGAAIRGAGRHRPVWAHPYSAFTWSGKDRSQLEWMSRLSDDVLVMSNFDTNDPTPCNDSGAVLYDYNISSVGPTPYFAAQAAKAAEMGRPILAKIETNTTPDVFFLPYLPVHARWRRRYDEMAKTGVAGFMGQWRFYGMNGSPPEEMQCQAVWRPDRTAEELLGVMARRDLGLDGRRAGMAVQAWQEMSDAWDDYPYSAMTAGEREFYLRGPMHYGPAHPMIFNPQNTYGLSPRFRELRGDVFEGVKDEALQEMIRNAKPRYVCEAMMAMPYGAPRYLKLIGRCRKRWASAVAKLKRAVGSKMTERARMELDVCETIEIHLTTVENVVRFHTAREELWRRPLDMPAFVKRIEGLKELVRREIANAERSLPILARDNRIGYIHCYGIAYDAEMVEDKLRQCRIVLNDELPFFDWTVRFHLWNDFS